jgi:alkanesulfonate monooxygenase SsuD/methylene tetrahydromethanopterin reductase-like flavin-dependent oxidoreductase (luciferase family)
MRFGLFAPNYGTFADPRWLAARAADAEAAGWDGFFLWDHVDYRGGPWPFADPWVALAAMAAATERLRLGTLVTPLTRRRPQVLARQTVTIDHLSGGRLVLGVGLGADRSRELSAFGEETDDRVRGAMLDEALELLTALWSGERVDHRGEHYLADGVQFLPVPVQRPRIPIWVGAVGNRRPPWRRAVRYDGVFPIRIGPDELAALLGELEIPSGFDVVTESRDGPWSAFADAGATWWLHGFDATDADTAVRAVVDAGPPIP